MGLYDTVYAECPECKGRVGFQSKAGNSYMYEFESKSVPLAIAFDLAGETRKCECGAVVALRMIMPMPQRIEMVVGVLKPEGGAA